MSFRIAFGAAVLAAMAATPAFAADAASCGLAPFAPAFPDPAAIARMAPSDAQTARHQAFEDVISWQKGLKTYRGCLDSIRNDDERKIALDRNGSKDDKDAIKDLQSEEARIDVLYNKTVDTEKSIVASFTSLSQAYCSRKDVDLTVCQQAK
jgi:hypothetical protein